MKREELLKVYAFAGAMWSSFKMPNTELEERLFDEVWYILLQPYEIDMILTAIREYATQSDFCNIAKIGEICQKYTEIQNDTYLDEEKILSDIQKAVSWDKCKENFENLTDFEKEIVQGPHMLARWANSGVFETVVMSNLRKTVRNKIEEKKFKSNFALIAENAKAVIGE